LSDRSWKNDRIDGKPPIRNEIELDMRDSISAPRSYCNVQKNAAYAKKNYDGNYG
jgi:hypothetical protein